MLKNVGYCIRIIFLSNLALYSRVVNKYKTIHAKWFIVYLKKMYFRRNKCRTLWII